MTVKLDKAIKLLRDTFGFNTRPVVHALQVYLILGPDASEDAKIAALLHDIVEDSTVTLKDLEYYGKDIVVDVAILTRLKDDKYFDYINYIKSFSGVVVDIKIADLISNLSTVHLLEKNKAISLKQRYLKALTILLRK